MIVLGAGVCGLALALMLARDGHDVTVLERDPDPVPHDPEAAWEHWERDGVVQFRQAHLVQARARQVLEDELPDVLEHFTAAGALRLDPLARQPPTIEDRSPRPDDARLVTWTGRRTTLEQVIARAAEDEVVVRRGVAVTSLETRDGRVTGVRTERGDVLAGRPRDRRDGPPLGAAEAAARRSRGGRGLRLPLLHALLPRAAAGDPRRAADRVRHVLGPLAARGRRRLVAHAVRVVARPAAQGAARSGALDGARARLPGVRALARRRADHRRGADGRRDRPLPDARAGAGDHQRRRRLGVHEPVARPRHRARAGARRARAPRHPRAAGATWPRRSTRRPSAS